MFNDGQAVRFNASSGSWGRVEKANHYGGYYVRWCYGLDAKGEPWTALSSVRPTEITPLDEATATEYFKCRCFSEEQEAIRKRVFLKESIYTG